MPGSFSRALGLAPGAVVALVGCGGKSALLLRLAAENRGGKVLLSTTTRMLPPPAELVDRVLGPGQAPGWGVNLFYTRQQPETGKLGATAAEIAPHCPGDGLTLLECDGSRGLPLKGWAEYEPAVPAFATLTLGVCTLWPLGLPLTEELVHRPQRYCALTGAALGRPVTLEHLAAMAGPGGMLAKGVGRRALFINQVESPEAAGRARGLAGLVHQADADLPVFAGSVQRGEIALIGAEP